MRTGAALFERTGGSQRVGLFSGAGTCGAKKMLVYGCAADGQLRAFAYDFCVLSGHDYAAARAMMPTQANPGTGQLEAAGLNCRL